MILQAQAEKLVCMEQQLNNSNKQRDILLKEAEAIIERLKAEKTKARRLQLDNISVIS